MSKMYGKCPYCEQEVTTVGSNRHVKSKHPEKYEEFRTGFEDWKKTATLKEAATGSPQEAPATEVQAESHKHVDKKPKPAGSMVDSLKSVSTKTAAKLRSSSDKAVHAIVPLTKKVYGQLKSSSKKAYSQVQTSSKKVVGQVKSSYSKVFSKTH